MTESARPRILGFNHIALEVGDIEEALAFYGRLFKFELRGKSDTIAFIDLGDQFLALQKGRNQSADDGRHFGLVVDDKEAARRALQDAGVSPIDGRFLDFRDPWGNRIEIVGYDNARAVRQGDRYSGARPDSTSANQSAQGWRKDGDTSRIA
jgi:catechol 2,3-dioxygenase-like lactoylglutathione lyase family enzyme